MKFERTYYKCDRCREEMCVPINPGSGRDYCSYKCATLDMFEKERVIIPFKEGIECTHTKFYKYNGKIYADDTEITHVFRQDDKSNSCTQGTVNNIIVIAGNILNPDRLFAYNFHQYTHQMDRISTKSIDVHHDILHTILTERSDLNILSLYLSTTEG